MDEQQPRRTLSRRALIGGAVGVGAVAIAGGGALVLPRLFEGPASGVLADRLVASGVFTVAHRGGSLDWPEMSMLGYRNSVGLGVDALEISLARSSDGVWFGLHDATLDRTSGTSGFVASEHTWDEIRRHRIGAKGTTDPSQPAQPYLRFEELVTAYAATHAIFVDPKVVPGSHFDELFAMMAASPTPKRTFVAKGYCTSAEWAQAATAHGYRTWGYYYASEVQADPDLLGRTEELWDWLGLDYGGAAEVWRTFEATSKPVLAHVVPSESAAETARKRGAAGLVISGVREVLGHSANPQGPRGGSAAFSKRGHPRMVL
ncbi:glycerophosphodiester phosphodiesterase family protein [Leifsonia sp. NPDC080035]|uniref:Glycerophosphodiester phosphodiesterase family protein n=1 Tax=Leifsonia sp. NPDC080035 TaxID=3143936 RepID=A0AAU7G8T7_9MICO